MRLPENPSAWSAGARGFRRVRSLSSAFLFTFTMAHHLLGPTSPLGAAVSIRIDWRGAPRTSESGTLLLRSESGRLERLRLEEPILLKPGRYDFWAWGPGWVALEPTRLLVPAALTSELVVPARVTPGCPLEFEGQELPEHDSLELLSAVGWHRPLQRPDEPGLSVPEGPGVLAYFRRGELVTFTPFRCVPTRGVRLATPARPQPGESRLWLSLASSQGAELGELAVFARSVRAFPTDAPIAPEGLAHFGRRAIAWFSRLPAGNYEVRVSGPGVRTVDLRVGLSAGAVHQAEGKLSPRAELLVPVSLQPLLGPVKIRLLRCAEFPLGIEAASERLLLGRCRPVEEQAVQSGAHRYRFRNLDRGQYAVEVESAHDLLAASAGILPEWFPSVEEGDASPEEPPLVKLGFLEVEGEVRIEGVRAAGELVLTGQVLRGPNRKARTTVPVSATGGFRWSFLTRVWPTATLETYLVTTWNLPREELRTALSRLPEEILASIYPVTSTFVSSSGLAYPEVAKLFFLGGGRCDLDFSELGTFEIRAFDATTNVELAQFGISVSAPRLLVWNEGQAVASVDVGAQILPQYFSSPARLELPARSKGRMAAITAPGYETYWAELPVLEPGELRKGRIALRPRVPDAEGGVELFGPGGVRLAEAYLLWLEPAEQLWTEVCLDLADSKGRLEANCVPPEESVALLIHPAIGVAALDPDELARHALRFESAPTERWLRLSTHEGEPIRRAELRFLLRNRPIDSSVFDLVRTRLGWPLPLVDERGGVLLPPLLSTEAWAVRVRRPGGEWVEQKLSPSDAQEVLVP